MSDLTCLNPNVFVSHICFIFQKKGCSHFWQESLSSHWGAYKTEDMKAIIILSAKKVCFKNTQWSFTWKSATSALDINTVDYLGYSTQEVSTKHKQNLKSYSWLPRATHLLHFLSPKLYVIKKLIQTFKDCSFGCLDDIQVLKRDFHAKNTSTITYSIQCVQHRSENIS